MSSEKTTNHNMNKWTGTDKHLRSEINANFDTIDEALGDFSELPTGEKSNLAGSVKEHVDNDTEGVHGSTKSATANKLIMRDFGGRAKVAAPVESDDIARKQETDTLQTQITNLSFTGSEHDALVTAALEDIENEDFGTAGNQTYLNGRMDKWEQRTKDIEDNINEPETTPLLEQTAEIFTVGTGKDEQGQDVGNQYVSSVENAPFGEMMVKGNTANGIVINGNFVDGSDWTPQGGNESVANNTYTLTGDGSSTYPSFSQDTGIVVVVGNKVFIKAFVRVTNSNCNNINLWLDGTTGGTDVLLDQQSSPSANTWYELKGIGTIGADFTGNIKVIIETSYADAASANGKVLEVQNAVGIDLAAHGLDNLSESDCADRFPYWWDGTKSTNPGVLQSRTSNSIDFYGDKKYKTNEIEYSVDSKKKITIIDSHTGLYKYFAIKTPVKPNTNYYLDGDVTSGSILDVRIFGESFVEGQNIALSDTGYIDNLGSDCKGTFNSGNNYYMWICYYPYNTGTNVIDNIQLVEGITEPTSFTEYEISEGFNPVSKLRSINNGTTVIRDKFDYPSGEHTQNVSDDYTLDSSKPWVLDATLTTVYRFRWASHDIFNIIEDASNEKRLLISSNLWTYSASYSGDTEHFYIDNSVYFFVNKSTIDAEAGATTIDKFNTWIDAQNASLSYQLAQSITTEYQPQPVQGFKKGTVIFYAAFNKALTYNTASGGLVFDYPIASIEWIKDVNGDKISFTDTIASDGLSAAITELSDGDDVFVRAPYRPEVSTTPTTKYKANVNQKAVIDGNVTTGAANTKAIQDINETLAILIVMQT